MISNKCRLCFEESGIISIFDNNSESKLLEKIKYCCVNINIGPEDGLPTHLCEACEKKIDSFYNFVLKCETTDKKLKALIIDDVKAEVEIKYESNSEESDSSLQNDNVVFYDSPQVEGEDGNADYNNRREEHKKYRTRSRKNVEENYSSLDLKVIVNGSKVRKKYQSKIRKRNVYKCETCNRICQSLSGLESHQRSHSDERPHICPTCAMAFKDRNSLKKHEERKHLKGKRTRNFICEHCGKAFYSKHEVKIHLRVHTKERPYACTICPSRFSQIGAYLRHKMRHTGERSHVCVTCGKKFLTNQELKVHIIVHTNERNFTCKFCSSTYKYRHTLWKHMEVHTERRSYICNYCNQNLTSKGNLQTHIRRLHSSESGYCNICSLSVGNYEVHMWKHTGKRPLKCEFCSNSYYDQRALAKHMNLKHKNRDKFQCTFDGCTYKCGSQAMLSLHVKKHSSVPPYTCDKCSRGFYRKSDLSRHKSGSHKEKLP